jgi:hypothetical protein
VTGVSAFTQVTNAAMVALRFGAGMQIFDASGESRSVCKTPWAKPLQKFDHGDIARTGWFGGTGEREIGCRACVDIDRWSFRRGGDGGTYPDQCQRPEDDFSHVESFTKCRLGAPAAGASAGAPSPDGPAAITCHQSRIQLRTDVPADLLANFQ